MLAGDMCDMQVLEQVKPSRASHTTRQGGEPVCPYRWLPLNLADLLSLSICMDIRHTWPTQPLHVWRSKLLGASIQATGLWQLRQGKQSSSQVMQVMAGCFI